MKVLHWVAKMVVRRVELKVGKTVAEKDCYLVAMLAPQKAEPSATLMDESLAAQWAL